MSKDIINLYAESDRDIVSDDGSSTITLENTANGSALTVKNSGATLGVALKASIPATGAPTIAVMVATNSVASGCFFEFKGFLASITSVSSLRRGIRVKVGDEYGFIPVYWGGTFI